MLESLMKKISEEKDKLIDKCMLEFFKHANIHYLENPTNWDMLMIHDQLTSKGYKIVCGINCIYLLKKEDSHDNFIAGYEFNLKVEENKISLTVEEMSGYL